MSIQEAARAGADATANKDDRAQLLGRMGDLLRRYPNVADAERVDLASFLKHGRPDDLALVTYGNGLEAQVAAFKKDHSDQFQSGTRALMPLLITLGVVLLLFGLLTVQLL